MTKSQKDLYNFYKDRTDKFDNILNVSKSDQGIVIIETNEFIYYIGKLGGLSSELKTN